MLIPTSKKRAKDWTVILYFVIPSPVVAKTIELSYII